MLAAAITGPLVEYTGLPAVGAAAALIAVVPLSSLHCCKCPAGGAWLEFANAGKLLEQI